MRARVGSARFIALFGTAILGTAAAGAAEGRIPVFGVTVINQPGHYVVTRDIGTSGGTPVVMIGGAGCTPFGAVTLDLNGRTLSSPSTVIGINSTCTAGGVTIRNGRLVGGGAGSMVGGGVTSASSTPVDLKLERVEIANVGGSALTIAAARSVHVEACSIHDVGGMGIEVSGGSSPFRGNFIANALTAIGWEGIGLEGMKGGSIKGNFVSDYGSTRSSAAGIRLSSTAIMGSVGGILVEGNTLTSSPGGTDDVGLYIYGIGGGGTTHNLIVGNVIQGNGSTGALILTDGNRIERNVLSGNLVGMQVGTMAGDGMRNHVEANSLQDNVSCGLILTDGGAHTWRGNIGGGNGATGLGCTQTGNTDLGGNFGL